MRLDRLTLTNVCQHETLDWEFDRGLIGIYGPNGSGKSNAMNLACYAGFTNDYSRHEQGKKGYIRQQASSDQKSEIRILFTQDNEQFEIVRGLQAPVKHELKFVTSGKTTLKKATEIQAELSDVLGIQRRLIDDFVFVGQHSLFSFLSAVPSERAKSFSHLCGTTKAEEIWEMLKDQVNADAGLVVDVTDDTDELRLRIGEYSSRIKTTQDELTEAKKGLLKRSEKAAADSLIELRQEQARLEEDVEELHTKFTTESDAADAARVIQLEADGELADAKAKAKGDDKKLEELAVTIAQMDSQSAKYADLADAKKRLATTEQNLVDVETTHPEELDQEWTDEKQDNLNDVHRRLDNEAAFVNSLATGAAKCPTCGTPTGKGSLEKRLTEARAAIPALEKELARYRKLKDALQKNKDEMGAYKHQLSTYTVRADSIRELIASIGDVHPIDADTLSDMEGERHDVMARRSEVENRQRACNDATSTYEGHRAVTSSLRKQHAEKATRLNEIHVNPEGLLKAKKALEDHVTANGNVTRHKAVITELEGFVETTRADIEKIERVQDRSARAAQWLEDLQDVRDEVMHRDKLPKIVHRNNLLDMEEDINEALDVFNSPFSVETTEDVGFTAHFANRTIMPSGGLSGGQKVMLAVPYRLTVNSLFASQVGMMVLDEPTDGLDQENRDLAAQVFVKLGEVARFRGHQVIVITHDDSLQNAFDQKFVLERPA